MVKLFDMANTITDKHGVLAGKLFMVTGLFVLYMSVFSVVFMLANFTCFHQPFSWALLMIGKVALLFAFSQYLLFIPLSYLFKKK